MEGLPGRVVVALVATACVPLVAVTLAVSEIVRKVLTTLCVWDDGPQIDGPPSLTGVTIVILNWNGRALLERNLSSVLRAADRLGSVEVIIVDNGSEDDSISFVRQHFPSIRLVTLSRNLGFSAGNNAGIVAASNDIVVVLNNDMLVDEDFLSPLLRAFSTHRQLFAASAQVFFQDPSVVREESGFTRGVFTRGFLQLEHCPVPESASIEASPILWAGGGSTAYDRRKLLALGSFDALYAPAYVEDVDLSFRAWQCGWASVLVPQSKVWHQHRASSRRRFTDAYIGGLIRRNLLLFTWRRMSWRLLAEHLAWLPIQSFGLYASHGARLACLILLEAMTRLPRVAMGRAIDRLVPRLTDQDILALGWGPRVDHVIDRLPIESGSDA